VANCNAPTGTVFHETAYTPRASEARDAASRIKRGAHVNRLSKLVKRRHGIGGRARFITRSHWRVAVRFGWGGGGWVVWLVEGPAVHRMVVLQVGRWEGRTHAQHRYDAPHFHIRRRLCGASAATEAPSCEGAPSATAVCVPTQRHSRGLASTTRRALRYGVDAMIIAGVVVSLVTSRRSCRLRATRSVSTCAPPLARTPRSRGQRPRPSSGQARGRCRKPPGSRELR